MRFKDLFLLSTRMFKARPSRTFLTILGMSVGIGAIIFLVSFGYGLQNTLLQKITTSDSLLTLDVASDRSKGTQLDQAAADNIKKMNGVAQVNVAYELSVRGSIENLSADLSAMAVEPAYIKLGGLKASPGKLLSDDEPNGVIISMSTAKIFGDPASLIGKNINLSFSAPKNNKAKSMSGGENVSTESENTENGISVPNDKFKILGVFDSDDSLIYVNVKAMGGYQPAVFSQLKVKCQDNKIMPEVQGAITAAGVSVSSISDTVDQANKIFSIIKIILMLFGCIALIVSAIGMFNTMTITLLERTEEIGIMKSIGASDGMISWMFIMESTIMGFLGGLIGIIIGWFEGMIFNFLINLIATHFGGEKVSLFYSPFWFIAAVIIFSAFVGFLTGIVPARRASKIDPLEALRYK